MTVSRGKGRAPRNRTLTLLEDEFTLYSQRCLRLDGPVTFAELENTTVNQCFFATIDWLPESFVDLLFIDPPYNLTKSFQSHSFKERSLEEYQDWFESWFRRILRVLKPTASVYICGDWRSSAAIHCVIDRYLVVRNRITWEREKGRGSKSNWKNCSEDIWFGTVSDDYTFHADAVKLKRQVLAPYRERGKPKDWQQVKNKRFRLTYPSNLWTDLTVPFWSMPENTDHPTQKPEKLLAKVILASSHPGDVVLDPFLGSGTTSVVAKKLGRKYVGIEVEPLYCAWAEKRLKLAEEDDSIQGYVNGVFWERNTLQQQRRERK
ncbi:MAG: site-specific DNA-methyltransferase [Firmicutes bacterium]|nr:site-specific DNA-methyltransferase [Bacillota bacterium]